MRQNFLQDGTVTDHRHLGEVEEMEGLGLGGAGRVEFQTQDFKYSNHERAQRELHNKNYKSILER